MSTRVFGQLVTDEIDGDGHRHPLVGFRVTVRWRGYNLGSGITGLAGVFEFGYRHRGPGVSGGGFGSNEVEFLVHDIVGRAIPFANESGRFFVHDVDREMLDGFGDLIVGAANATGLLVTLNTNEAQRVSSGNRVRMLIDQEAFTRGAEVIASARESITMSQLYMMLPDGFRNDPAQETPKLVFDVHQTPTDLDHPRALLPTDARPERLLTEAALRNVDVRILLHDIRVPLILKILLGMLVFPVAGSDGVAAALGSLASIGSWVEEAKRYFSDAAPAVKVRSLRQQPALSDGVMHAKLLDVDGRYSICFGSPWDQSYIDTHEHRIDSWIRGDSDTVPRHDVGYEVAGPAMLDLYRAQKLLWDTASPEDPLPDLPSRELPPGPVLPPPPPAPEMVPEAETSIQVVRTLSVGRFAGIDEGEKGILEAYLRAFNNAKKFIYLETQYFTNETIGRALVEAMKNKPELKVIVMVNIAPDVPLYPRTQRRLITRIRKGIGQQPGGPQRFGVFTRWTHETGSPRPRILPIYLHSKIGIVDDTWATVGSANLDGLSLDSFGFNDFVRWLIPFLPDRDQRAVEINAVMMNEANSPEHPSAADVLRRRVWAEHLGFSTPTGEPDPDAPALQSTTPPTDWLALWSSRAKATLQQLIDHPTQSQAGMARVLPWPDDDSTHKTPGDHLRALKVRTHAVVPLKSTRAFDFRTGQWKPGSVAKMDY